MTTSTLRRTGRFALPLVVAVGAGLASAAFTDEASNEGNRASAADVTISTGRAATSPVFDLADWRPGGGPERRCVTVTNEGSVPVPLTMRLDGAPTGGLAGFIDMTVERGAGCDAFAADGEVFSGELAAFPATAAGALADGGPALAPGASRAYRVTWELQDDEEAEGLSVAGVDFLWTSSS
jgi:hypothetical protein